MLHDSKATEVNIASILMSGWITYLLEIKMLR